MTKPSEIFWLSNDPAMVVARRAVIILQPLRLVIPDPHLPHDLQLDVVWHVRHDKHPANLYLNTRYLYWLLEQYPGHRFIERRRGQGPRVGPVALAPSVIMTI